jgi:MFS family permease
MTGPTPPKGAGRALANRNYRLWFIGFCVSNIGVWMQRVAQDWLVLELTHRSGMALGVTTGLQFLPFLVFGTAGGVLADRYPKRQLLIATQVTVGVVGLTLGLLVLAHQARIWEVYTLAVLLGAASATYQPAAQSFVMELVGPAAVRNAVGLSGGSFQAARAVGPAVAGLLINVGGTGPVFVLAALTVLSPITALLRMREEELHPVPALPRRRGMLVEGVRYAAREPRVRLVLAVMVAVAVFALNSQVTNALMASQVFHRGAGQYGLLGTLAAVGSLGGAMVVARRDQVDLRFVLSAAVLFCAAQAASGLMPNFWTFGAWLVLVGFTQLLFITSANSVLQLTSAPHMRGRVMALYSVAMMGTTPLGAPVVGWLAQHIGVRFSLVSSAAAGLAGVLAAVALLRRSAEAVAPPAAETDRIPAGEDQELVAS